MADYRRRTTVGAVAGAISSVVLIATLDNTVLGIILGIAVGIGFAIAFPLTQRTYFDTIMTTAAFGIPLWSVFSVIVRPVLAGQNPQWTSDGLQALFPALIGWVLYGALLGLLVHLGTYYVERIYGPIALPPQPIYNPPTRIVILGGGFAGITLAQNLEKKFRADPSVAFTLISDTNALLFTPMLAEVAGGSLEPTHISPPLRTSLRRTDVVRGTATAIDVQSHSITLAPDTHFPNERRVTYDHLVLALGAKSNYLGLKSAEAYSYDFKTLLDAIRIRNRVIEMFETANDEPDPATRRALLTFVIAGAGFSGAELGGAINDFARNLVAYYPRIEVDDVRVVIVHSRDRILPELSETLGRYALERMRERHVEFCLTARVTDVQPTYVVLHPPQTIPTHTVIWTAGTRPHPLVQGLPIEHDKRGAVVVDGTMAVAGVHGLWALGDNAAIPNGTTGQTAPPTAQYALREAKRLAANLHATTKGGTPKPFYFRGLGTLAVVGYQTACAEVFGFRFSGLFAWLLWRAIYLEKLPGLEQRVRVLADWIIELFFPRDIVQTLDVTERPQPTPTAIHEVFKPIHDSQKA